jgi:hypothetical protein
MKCQEAEALDQMTGKTDRQTMCVWADYSTLGLILPAEGGRGLSTEASAKIAADFRKDVRVPAR